MEVEKEEVKKLAEEEFLKKKGITGISVKHQSPKIIRIYVEKLDPALLKEIPKQFMGYKVEVIEVGRVEPLLTPEERRLRWRPIFPGISIGSVRVTAGTLTGIAKDNLDEEYVILSNYHVFWGNRGERIVQPGIYDGGTIDDTVGFLKRWIEIKPEPAHNFVDSAIASLTVDFNAEEPDLGMPVGVRDPREGEIIAKAGRTTAITEGRVIDEAATIKVHDYPGVGDVIFDDIIVTEYMATGGDSGSVAFAKDGRWVGQCFAGSNKITCFIKSRRIVESLNITPILGVPKIAPVRMAMLPLVALAMFPVFPKR